MHIMCTGWKAADSIPVGVIGIFIGKLVGHAMAPGSTHPLTEMNSRDISWEVKAAGV